jgi:hypothetical protein
LHRAPAPPCLGWWWRRVFFLLAVARACLCFPVCQGPSKQLPGRWWSASARCAVLRCGVSSSASLPSIVLVCSLVPRHMLIAAALLTAAILSRRCSVRPAVAGAGERGRVCARMMWCGVSHVCVATALSLLFAQLRTGLIDRSLSLPLYTRYTLNGPGEGAHQHRL